MSTIRSVVEQNIDPSHMAYAGRAISALERRDNLAVAVIRRRANARGISTEQINEVLIEAGLVERPRPPAQQAQGRTAAERITLEGVAASLERINERLDRASRQASRHGISF